MLLSIIDRIKSFLGLKPKESVVVTAPYKVEPQPPMVEPVPTAIVQTPAMPEPTPVVAPAPEPVVAPAADKPKRTRAAKGKFKGDDKLTVETNEAWVGGKSPAKKTKPRQDSKPKKLTVVQADKPKQTKKKTVEK